MTTTGGPEHFLADPAITNSSAHDPVVIDRVADGDDIVVEPASPRSLRLRERQRRARRNAIGAAVAVLIVGGIAIVALATRHHSSPAGASLQLRSLASANPPAAHPASAGGAKPATKVKLKPKVKTAPARPQTPKLAPPKPAPPKAKPVTKTTVAVAPPASVATPPPTVHVTTPPPPPATTVTTPPVESPSVLQWTATPASLTLAGGAHANVTVTVSNPTSGTVTLSTPLTCAPILRGPHGAVIGEAICEQMAQEMAPHSKLTQQYTIYATDSAGASGQPLAPGPYSATVENLFKIQVHVTS